LGTLEISSDLARVDRELVFEFLTTRSYWATERTREQFETSLEHSLVFGAYEGARQIAFARVVTDRATFAYLCDVFVVESEQGRGVGRRLMDAVMEHPELQGLRRFQLVTRDAQRFYERYGFRALAQPERHMERPRGR